MAQQLGFNHGFIASGPAFSLPGPAMVSAQWDDVKDLIIDLYTRQRKPLKEVRNEISSRYGFVRG
jgi:hypothetical protein